MRRKLPPSTLVAVAALAGLAVLVVGGFLDLRAAAAAWLLASFVALGLTTGALSLLLTGRLTGGDWIEALAPVLRPLALLVPLAGLAFVPLIFLLPPLYPWAADGAHDPAVGLFYLNLPLLVLRLVTGVAGWTALAFAGLAMEGDRGRIVAGLGLVFHIVLTSFFAYDWMMALQPSFTSSVFGAHTAILFLLSGLAFAALVGPLPSGKPRRDIAGLIIAGVLGVIYIGFMQFLIIWYGNLPDTTQFYLDRSGAAATTALLLALAVGGLLPLALLVSPAGRASAATIRSAALLVLAGIVLYWGWCVCGLVGAFSAVLAPAAFLVLVSAAAWVQPIASGRLNGEAV